MKTKTHLLALLIVLQIINLNAQNINPKDSLVLYYPFNADLNDHSGNGYDGKVNGAVLTGEHNKACFFDGINDSIAISDVKQLEDAKYFTVSCWINPFVVKPWDSWISKTKKGRNTPQWRIGFGENQEKQLQFTIHNQGWNDNNLDYNLELKQWYHVLYLVDNVNHKVEFYVNGKNVGLVNIREIVQSNGTLYIGFQRFDFVFFYGMIDEVLIYNRLLNNSEIELLYANFKNTEKPSVNPDLFKSYNEPKKINSKENVKVTYLTNAGFLLETDKKKILVDALIGDPRYPIYDVFPNDMKNNLENGKAPFNNIDIIAVTHEHWDHFSKNKVVSFLLMNPMCKLICPNSVNDTLKKSTDYDKIKSRIVAVSPDFNADTLVSVNGIKTTILRLDHTRTCGEFANPMTDHLKMENTGFVFNINGIHVFHSGDSYPDNEKEYETLDIKQFNIDIALINRSFANEKGKMFIDKYITPKNLVFMHMSNQSSYIYKPFAEGYNNKNTKVLIFEKSMETIDFK